MAILKDIIPEFQIKKITNYESKVLGIKRRAWLEIDDKKILEQKKEIRDSNCNTFHKKESINTVYKPPLLHLADLRSNPLKLIQFLFMLAELEGDQYETRKVRLKEMVYQLKITKDSIRTALRFLLKNNLITRIEYQVGVQGWSKYKIEKNLAEEININLKERSMTSFKIVEDFHNKKIDNNNMNIDQNFSIWENIDITPLEKIGLKNNHLLQLRSKTTPEILQESINHFAFSLENNPKSKNYKNPIAIFISVMKRGEAWIEPNYRSSQELAQQKFVENKKAELERKTILLEETYKLAFIEWKNNLNQPEISKIINEKNKNSMMPSSVKLNLYFQKEIWPSKKNEYSFYKN